MDISNKKGSKVGGLTIFLVILMSVPTLSFAEECPQIRKTQIAPKEFLIMQNPLPLNDKNLKAAEKLFEKTAKPIACKTCHGITGNGVGDPGFESTPLQEISPALKPCNNSRMVSCFGSSKMDQKTHRCMLFQTYQIIKFGS